MEPKYPIKVRLSGKDGNAFAIIGAVAAALRSAKVDKAEIQAFQREAMSGDYDNVIATAMRYVEVS